MSRTQHRILPALPKWTRNQLERQAMRGIKTMSITRMIQTVDPKDFKVISVKCRACGTAISFPLRNAKPVFTCPNCKTVLATQTVSAIASALQTLQQMPPSEFDVEFEVSDGAKTV